MAGGPRTVSRDSPDILECSSYTLLESLLVADLMHQLLGADHDDGSPDQGQLDDGPILCDDSLKGRRRELWVNIPDVSQEG